MAKLPSIPDVPSGIKGLMTPGVDLGTFQAKTMGNLTSLVSSYSPGKSILGVAAANSAMAAAKGKLGALKAAASGATGGAAGLIGAVKSAAGSAVVGALGGAALNALSGGKTSLSSIGGNLLGSAAGAVGANIGASLSGTSVPGASSLGAGIGGFAAGALGKSVGSKLAIGALAGGAVGAVTGIITGKVNNSFGITSPTDTSTQPPTQEATQTSQESVPSASPAQSSTGAARRRRSQESAPSASPAPSPAPKSPAPARRRRTSPATPDLSNNTPTEITALADKSSQSVPVAAPIEPPPSVIPPPKENSTTAPSQASTTSQSELEIVYTSPPGKAISDVALFGATKKVNLFWTTVQLIIGERYYRTFSHEFDDYEKRMVIDITKLTDSDRAAAKETVNNFKGGFSLAYSSVAEKSDPDNRVLGFTDFLCLTTEDFYKLLTAPIEGGREISEISFSTDESSKQVYNVFTSSPSPSTGLITISSKIYGTGTGEVKREIPLPMNEFFDYGEMGVTRVKYMYGTDMKPVTTGTMWDATKPKEGAKVRMYAANQRWFFCGKNITTSQKVAGIATGKNSYDNFADTPPASRVDNGNQGWFGKAKISNDSYYIFTYHPYTLQVAAISAYKTLPKS